MSTDRAQVGRHLDSAMDSRRLELRLRWNQVADRAGMTYSNLHKIRKGQIALTSLAQAGLESALEWPRGHIAELLAPMTDQQSELMRVYHEEYVPRYGSDEAQRRLHQDVAALNAAIERDKRTAG